MFKCFSKCSFPSQHAVAVAKCNSTSRKTSLQDFQILLSSLQTFARMNAKPNICIDANPSYVCWCAQLSVVLWQNWDRSAGGGTPPVQAHKTALWKATSISTQTSAVTQIRQPQCSRALSPAAGGGQPDLRRMETFSPRNGQNQLFPPSINAAPRLLLSSFLCNHNSLRPVMVAWGIHATRLNTDDNWPHACIVVQVKVSATHLGDHFSASPKISETPYLRLNLYAFISILIITTVTI